MVGGARSLKPDLRCYEVQWVKQTPGGRSVALGGWWLHRPEGRISDLLWRQNPPLWFINQNVKKSSPKIRPQARASRGGAFHPTAGNSLC